jgi:putative addiction module component (TIGR02574 family)
MNPFPMDGDSRYLDRQTLYFARAMSRPLERLESEALELPVRERAALAHRLIASLDEGPEDDPTEVELAWEEEIRRRLAAYRSGEVQTIPSDEVFVRAHALLR